ncbi:hypothetical protein MJM95_30735, partial [Salmonella enterica subsp. enterica serovar Anatum]|nr:hypothetical protein [Salmonella enterica subsp. enterica serovar Anatum]
RRNGFFGGVAHHVVDSRTDHQNIDSGIFKRFRVGKVNPAFRQWLLLMLSLLQQPHEVDSLLADIIGLNALLLSHKEHASFLQIF